MPHDVSRVLPSLPPPASLQLDLGKTSFPATSENPWFPQGRHTPKKNMWKTTENPWFPVWKIWGMVEAFMSQIF